MVALHQKLVSCGTYTIWILLWGIYQACRSLLVQFQVGCSRGIIRNRASILSLLASLSEASASSSRQKTEAFPSLTLSQNPVTLRPSSRTGSVSSNFSGANTGVSGYHPPLPPKPRSRPSSQHLDQADGESRGSVDRESGAISGRGAASEPSARGSANLPTARPKGQWPQ